MQKNINDAIEASNLFSLLLKFSEKVVSKKWDDRFLPWGEGFSKVLRPFRSHGMVLEKDRTYVDYTKIFLIIVLDTLVSAG